MRSVSLRALGVLLIALAGATVFAIGSSTPAASQGGPPFITEGQADERYLQRRWVEVDAAGTLLRSSDSSVTVQGGNSSYIVRFGTLDVTQCAVVGSIGAPFVENSGDLRPGEISVATDGPSGGPGAVLVRTFDSDGIPAPRFFQLQVLC